MESHITIRAATLADIPALPEYYARVDQPSQAPWIEMMMDGRHPYTRAEHFVLAEDTAAGKIVSASVGMPWTYLYDGLPIPVTRMEQVFTDPEYQGRGLMKAIFDRIHAASAARGDILQVVYGRPGLYRHLGYALGLPNEEEGRQVAVHAADPGPEPLEYSICPADDADFPFVADLYRRAADRYAVCTRMGLPEIYYGGRVYVNESVDAIRDRRGETVGFIRFLGTDVVYTLELSAAVSYYQFRRSFLWHLKQSGVGQVSLKLGEHHPFYDVLDEFPQKKLNTLRGYARIADLPAFLRAVTPVLDRRLAASAYAGYEGSLGLCLHHKAECYRLDFAAGRLARVEPVAQEWGDVYLIRDRLIQLLLGRLSLEDLDRESAEVYFNHPDARRLFGILFPKKQSFIYSVN